MRNGLTIFIGVVLVVAALVALNALSYAPIERKPDSEATANRSTYNAGASGTKALYDFLSESGYQVVRWRDPVSKLGKTEPAMPMTLVLIGQTAIPLKTEESTELLAWVSRGNRLVLIDRAPEIDLLKTTGLWKVVVQTSPNSPFNVQSGNTEALTAETKPALPAQPTSFTRDVEAVQPSRFASAVRLIPKEIVAKHKITVGNEDYDESEDADQAGHNDPNEEPPPPPMAPTNPTVGSMETAGNAPVVHLSGDKGDLLVDYSYGKGRITVLADPFIVSNAGISLSDNLQLAMNVVAAGGGNIAFDEFHQGQGRPENEIAAYFRGTPVLAALGQASLLVLAVLWTKGKRFGRPLPLANVDRRSTLEFVSSMAELQQRARAFDLAIENVYMRLRRVLVRYSGSTFDLPRKDIATKVAERAGINGGDVEMLMRDCENVINGEPADEKKTVNLVRRLRALERRLGMGVRQREEGRR